HRDCDLIAAMPKGPEGRLDKNADALFEPRLVKGISLVGEYEILPGDEDDGGLARVGRVGRGGAEVLIAFDAPTPMGDTLDRQHRPGAVGPIEIFVPRRRPLADEKTGQLLSVGIARRGVAFDLGIDRLPFVRLQAGGLFAHANKAGDVIRPSRFAGLGHFLVVALGRLERTDVAAGLLAARGSGIRRRPCADQRDERAASQWIELHSLPSQGRIADYPISKCVGWAKSPAQRHRASPARDFAHAPMHIQRVGNGAPDFETAHAGCWRMPSWPPRASPGSRS